MDLKTAADFAGQTAASVSEVAAGMLVADWLQIVVFGKEVVVDQQAAVGIVSVVEQTAVGEQNCSVGIWVVQEKLAEV